MPAAKSTSARSDRFRMLSDAASAMNETNDCSVKALALACNVTYNIAHQIMATVGKRKNRGGAYTCNILAAVEACGHRYERVDPSEFISQYPKAHQVLKGLTTHHPERFNKVWADGSTYMMFTRSHVLTIINGENHDWTKGKAKRCESIYRIVRK